MNSKNKIYRLIAGITLLLAAVLKLIWSLRMSTMSVEGQILYIFCEVCAIIALTLMGVGMVTSKYPLALAGSIVYLISGLYNYRYLFKTLLNPVQGWQALLLSLIYLIPGVVLIIAYVNKKAAPALGIVAAAVTFYLCILRPLIVMLSRSGFYMGRSSVEQGILLAVGFVCTGLAYASASPKKPAITYEDFGSGQAAAQPTTAQPNYNQTTAQPNYNQTAAQPNYDQTAAQQPDYSQTAYTQSAPTGAAPTEEKKSGGLFNTDFRRCDGFAGSIPQKFADANLPNCPLCGSRDPYWTLKDKMEMKGNRVMFKCKDCGGILSATVEDFSGKTKSKANMLTTAGLTNALIKKHDGKEVGTIYVRVDQIGSDQSSADLLNQEIPLDKMQALGEAKAMLK